MFEKIIRIYVRIVQKTLITIFLVMLYIFGFGVIYILALLFNRKLLGIGKKEKDTFWVESIGYDINMTNSSRES